jgi:hypothetical protein
VGEFAEHDAWGDIRRLATGARLAHRQTEWSELMGEDSGEGLLYDVNGNDCTPLLLDLLGRLERVTGEVVVLSDRVKTLEKLAVHDEARLAAEIESLRGRP